MMRATDITATSMIAWPAPSPSIGIGGHLATPPSHTTGHTGPYHGGSAD